MNRGLILYGGGARVTPTTYETIHYKRKILRERIDRMRGYRLQESKGMVNLLTPGLELPAPAVMDFLEPVNSYHTEYLLRPNNDKNDASSSDTDPQSTLRSPPPSLSSMSSESVASGHGMRGDQHLAMDGNRGGAVRFRDVHHARAPATIESDTSIEYASFMDLNWNEESDVGPTNNDKLLDRFLNPEDLEDDEDELAPNSSSGAFIVWAKTKIRKAMVYRRKFNVALAWIEAGLVLFDFLRICLIMLPIFGYGLGALTGLVHPDESPDDYLGRWDWILDVEGILPHNIHRDVFMGQFTSIVFTTLIVNNDRLNELYGKSPEDIRNGIIARRAMLLFSDFFVIWIIVRIYMVRHIFGVLRPVRESVLGIRDRHAKAMRYQIGLVGSLLLTTQYGIIFDTQSPVWITFRWFFYAISIITNLSLINDLQDLIQEMDAAERGQGFIVNPDETKPDSKFDWGVFSASSTTTTTVSEED